MHVAAFYSYKGGVGRTLALMNSAAKLATSGQRVLVVDFDLEAPGLHTYSLPQPRVPSKGVVDYVNDYIASGVAPEVEPYVYECGGIGKKGGGLWVMPAGRFDAQYQSRLHSIDWTRLYAEMHGFALFENLRAQWREHLSPDYVLIDSRTGHTDVGGICTRQLPDSLVVFFFPNSQNLGGVSSVVKSVRTERTERRKAPSTIHFVMSNVPSLDDENEILSDMMGRFSKELELTGPPLVINHYPSLDLLNQEIFTLKKPRTALAEQYGALVQTIRRGNAEDAEGAKEWLRDIRRDMRSPRRLRRTATKVDSHLEEIQRLHGDNGELLFMIAEILRRQGKHDQAVSVLDSAANTGYKTPQLWLELAECHLLTDEDEGQVISAIDKLLADPKAGEYQVNHAVQLLAQVDPQRLLGLPDAPAVRSMDGDGLLWLARELNESVEAAFASHKLLARAVTLPDVSEEFLDACRLELSLRSVALGRFDEAKQIIQRAVEDLDSAHIAHRFNHAIADWGERGTPDADAFRRVVQDDPHETRDDANFFQCLALAAWASGNGDLACEHLDAARSAIMNAPKPTFSCWRYLTVSLKAFMDDLEQMKALFAGGSVEPRFLRQRAEALKVEQAMPVTSE